MLRTGNGGKKKRKKTGNNTATIILVSSSRISASARLSVKLVRTRPRRVLNVGYRSYGSIRFQNTACRNNPISASRLFIGTMAASCCAVIRPDKPADFRNLIYASATRVSAAQSTQQLRDVPRVAVKSRKWTRFRWTPAVGIIEPRINTLKRSMVETFEYDYLRNASQPIRVYRMYANRADAKKRSVFKNF